MGLSSQLLCQCAHIGISQSGLLGGNTHAAEASMLSRFNTPLREGGMRSCAEWSDELQEVSLINCRLSSMQDVLQLRVLRVLVRFVSRAISRGRSSHCRTPVSARQRHHGAR